MVQFLFGFVVKESFRLFCGFVTMFSASFVLSSIVIIQ